MPDLADLFPGYASHWIDTAAGKIFARSGGKGPPLLLLHGYAQTNVMWHKVSDWFWPWCKTVALTNCTLAEGMRDARLAVSSLLAANRGK